MSPLNLPFRLILASNSPRRQNLLGNIGVDFEVYVRVVDESFPDDIDALDVAPYLAALKGEAYNDYLTNDMLIITADTTVVVGNEVINKPENESEAIKMLEFLSGKKHTVVTGVHLNSKSKSKTFAVKTDVYFKKLERMEIEYYVQHFKPFDKAGSYGIQEWLGYIGVERIDGCFFNVMGLPLHKVYEELRTF